MIQDRYVNAGREIDLNLGYLSPTDRAFYHAALKYFHSNVDAAQFDAFAFGPQSPIYRSGCSSLRHDSLYKALRDMWFQLCTRSNK